MCHLASPFSGSRRPWIDLADYEVSSIPDTNSTVSGILGPGRVVDVLLHRAGRGLEQFFIRYQDRRTRRISDVDIIDQWSIISESRAQSEGPWTIGLMSWLRQFAISAKNVTYVRLIDPGDDQPPKHLLRRHRDLSGRLDRTADTVSDQPPNGQKPTCRGHQRPHQEGRKAV
jgi:hypothetical protein